MKDKLPKRGKDSDRVRVWRHTRVEGLKKIYAGKKFQHIEVMGISVIVNEFVETLAMRKTDFGGIIDFNSSEHVPL